MLGLGQQQQQQQQQQQLVGPPRVRLLGAGGGGGGGGDGLVGLIGEADGEVGTFMTLLEDRDDPMGT